MAPGDWFSGAFVCGSSQGTAAPLQVSSAPWTAKGCISGASHLCVLSCRFRVFDNRVLKGKLEFQRKEQTVGWIKLHNEEFYTLFTSQVIIRVI
jgi:hypothetical protein